MLRPRAGLQPDLCRVTGSRAEARQRPGEAAPRLGILLAAVILVGSLGCRPRRGTAVEGYAFVAVGGSSSLAVVDLATFSVSRQIPLGSQPVQILSDPARRALYVMGTGGPAGLTVIDTAKLEVKRALWLADQPQRVRLAPEGGRLYVIDGRAHLFKSFQLEAMSPERQIHLAASPVDFDVSPDGRRACVSLISGEVAVVDLNGWRVTATIRVGGEPGPVLIRSDSRQAFVANRADRSVAVVDLAGGRLVTFLPLHTRPEAMRFKPDGGELFISGGDTSAVVILSAYRDEIDQPMLAGAEPRDIAITKDNRLAFVANSAANSVSVIAIDDRRMLASVPAGQEPHRLALTPDDQYLLALNRKSGDMAVIRIAAVTGGRGRIQPLFTMIRVGSEPVDLAVQSR